MESSSNNKITDKTRCEILKLLEEGKSYSQIYRQFMLKAPTISSIFECQNRVKNQEECKSGKSKKIVLGYYDIDKAVFKWYKYNTPLEVPIDGKMIIAKANEFAKLGNLKGFNCAHSWLQRFRAKHKIPVRGKIFIESSKVDRVLFENSFENVWPTMRRDYEDDEIFNAVETAVLYKVLPNQIIRLKGEKGFEETLPQERITVLVAANMTGTRKMELVVIGKSKNPRCFKNVNVLPVRYYNDKKALMTSIIFEKILKRWDTSLRKEKRKILLVIDDGPAHPQVELENIKLIFLPTSCKPIMQPLHQGVIKSLKLHFRKQLILSAIKKKELKQSNKVTLLEGIQHLSCSWQQVTENSISNCFEKAGFTKWELILPSADFNYDEDEAVLSELRLLLNKFPHVSSLNDYIDVDKDLLTSYVPTVEEIVDEVCAENKWTNECDTDSETESETETESEKSELNVDKTLNNIEGVTTNEELKTKIHEKLKLLN
ncbi:tigger transposable element-derived protein 4-like [Condylostylus longicornis]|uniref:tigger transposable element-derived protein 4-like n=1 Tax=Condylostylus longicornis TaxID=2530218 RepID=UPI00244E4C44|nr:tigger transposable element-derived protein 4-like [Condylostylus longicornis]